MKRVIAEDATELDTSRFHPGVEYKLIKKSGELGQRTFTVVKVAHSKMAIQVKGGISGIYRMTKDNKGNEMIALGMSDRNYLNPCSTDIA